MEAQTNGKTINKYPRAIWNVLSIIGAVLAVVLFCEGFKQGIFTSEEAMQAFLSQYGAWAPLLFVTIQILQVVMPIIPGGITLAAGVLLFGPWWGFLYNYVGICIGSALNFLLARHYGRPFVKGIAGERIFNKYIGRLSNGKSFERFFAISIFLPVAPDDYLCMLAGLTQMELKTFILIILLGKPASIFLYSIGLTAVIQYFLQLL
jgi:Uncharacterized conserved protein